MSYLQNIKKNVRLLSAVQPPSIYVFSYFPFGFEGRMSDLIVSVPDHCLSFYFKTKNKKKKKKKRRSIFSQSICEAAILYIAFLYSWAILQKQNDYIIFLLWNEEKDGL